MANSHVSDAPVLPFTAWYGFPKGTATCAVTVFSPATVSRAEPRSIHPATDKVNRHPVLVFLVRHTSTGKLALFDLGLGKDWQKTVPKDRVGWYEEEYDPKVEAGLDEVLAARGIKPEDVETVVLSHHHFDHIGDPSLFPHAQVVVGPGTKDEVASLDFRQGVRELSWAHSPTRLASFEHSHNVWGDGSFVLVALPGHTAGHVGAFVRTRAGDEGEYVLLAADAAHHPRLLAPPKPNEPRYEMGRWRELDEPVSEAPRHSMYEDYVKAEGTLERVKTAGRREEVMVVLSHDFAAWERWGGKDKALGGVDLSEWKKKGMKGY
ncbi:hypothetical protein JCM10450v2_004206 [Rhodotorula kratochvilovae]